MDKEHFMREFRKVFPSEAPEALEMTMRQRLIDMVKDNGVILSMLNNENEADINLFSSIVIEFLADPENTAWMQGQFQGDYQAFGEWVVDVFQNPTPSSVDFLGPTVEDEPLNNVENDFLPERLDPQQESAQITPTELLNLENKDTTSIPGDDRNKEIVRETRELSVFAPELLTDEGLKKTLSESFSPERFNRAMQTLNQYGSKEGMRHLKELDPAVATEIERFRQQSKDDP